MDKYGLLRWLSYSLILVSLTTCSKEVTSSLWHNKDIIRENETGALETPLRFFDAKSRLQYTVLNDNENLYICVKAMENQSQTKLMRAGLQIWIDTTGGGKKQINLSYPLPAEDPKNSDSREVKDGSNNERTAQHNHFLLSHPDMMLTGFKGSVNGLLPIENKFGIAVNIHWDSIGTLVYKARIPFRSFYHELSNDKDINKLMSIKLIVPALMRDKEASTNTSRGRSGSRNGGSMEGGMSGGGRGMGGGMRGGRGGGSRQSGQGSYGQSSDIASVTEISLNIRMALNASLQKNK